MTTAVTPVTAVYNYLTEPNPMGQPFLETLAGRPTGYALSMDRVLAVMVRAGCKGAGVTLSDAEAAELTDRLTKLQETLPPWKAKIPAIFV